MRTKSINKKNKLHVKFDKDDRKDYLKGFRKRKEERKQKAKVRQVQKVKQEKRRVKKKQQEMVKKMINQCVILGEDDSDSEAYEEIDDAQDQSNTVTTTCGATTVEISDLDLADTSYLGANTSKTLYKDEKPESASEEESEIACTNRNPKQFIKSMFRSAAKSIKIEKSLIRQKNKFKPKRKKKILVTEL